MPSKLGSILDMAGMVIKNLGAPVAATDASTKKYVDDQVALASGGAVVPPGVIQMYGGTTAPTGWVLCHRAVGGSHRGTYDALFGVIGTTFGRRCERRPTHLQRARHADAASRSGSKPGRRARPSPELQTAVGMRVARTTPTADVRAAGSHTHHHDPQPANRRPPT